MSDNNHTSHQDLLALWQQKFQDFITDPEVTKAMLNNHKTFQNYLHGLYQQSPTPSENHETNAAPQHNASNDGDVQLAQLAKRVAELEQQVALLRAANRHPNQQAAG